MSNEEEELIKHFVDVTGVSEERAKFYIESSNSNLEVNFCFYRLKMSLTQCFFFFTTYNRFF